MTEKNGNPIKINENGVVTSGVGRLEAATGPLPATPLGAGTAKADMFLVEFKQSGKKFHIESQDLATAQKWADIQMMAPGFKGKVVVTPVTAEAKKAEETPKAEAPAKPLTAKDKKAAKEAKTSKAKAERELEKEAKIILAKAKKDEPRGQSLADKLKGIK